MEALQSVGITKELAKQFRKAGKKDFEKKFRQHRKEEEEKLRKSKTEGMKIAKKIQPTHSSSLYHPYPTIFKSPFTCF